MIYNIINLMFGKEISISKLDKLDIGHIYYCYNQIQLYINEEIHKKFSNIANINGVIDEGESGFDEFDKEEGYVGDMEEKNVYETYKEILNYNIKYSIDYLKNSYKESMECNLSELLDFILFDKKYRMESKNGASYINDIEDDF